MNAYGTSSATVEPKRVDYEFRAADGQDYQIRVTRYPDDSELGFYISVQVNAWRNNWWCSSSIVCDPVHENMGDWEAIKWAFRSTRSHMRKWLRYWNDNRNCARNETGGKRGYYTRHANENLKYALRYAEQWRMCKMLWKGLTKLI